MTSAKLFIVMGVLKAVDFAALMSKVLPLVQTATSKRVQLRFPADADSGVELA